MKRFNAAQKSAKKFLNKLDRKGIISIVQIGSSLRKEDFTPDSDIDLLVIYGRSVKNTIKHESFRGFDIQMIQQGKSQFIKSLKAGIPVYLIALKSGKVLYDNGFFEKQRKIGHKPTKETIDRWLHTASFNFSDAFMNYTISTYEYFKSLRNAAREFSRTIILKELGEIVEGNMTIIRKLSINHPRLSKNFKLVVDGSRSCKGKDSRILNVKNIKNSGMGKYFLAAEDIAIEAFRICKNMAMPKINELILKISRKYKFGYLHSFHFEATKGKILANVSLKNGKAAVFIYDMKNNKLRKC